MKKVLYVTTVSRTVNAFLVPHIQMLLKEGYRVDIATCIDKPVDASLTKQGVTIFDIPFGRNPLHPGNFIAFSKLIKLQKQKKYDIVHVHTPVAALFGRLLKLFFPKLKTIYTAHGYHFLKGGPKSGWLLYYPIEKVMAKLTDVTITINKEDYDITRKKLKPKQTYLMNGVGLDLEHYTVHDSQRISQKRKELGLLDDDFVIIMIAELNENKNQIQLIKALSLLHKRYPNIKALFVGEGAKLDELETEVTKRNLNDNVQFLGFRTDIVELINVADMGVLLSYREGLPRNLMELMACGKPCVGTNIRGIRDVISSGTLGKIIGLHDIKQTAYAIEQLYIDKLNPNIIVQKVKKYDVGVICEALRELY